MKRLMSGSGIAALVVGGLILTVQPAAGQTVAEGPPGSGEPLVVGTLLPETGALSFLGPGMVAGARVGMEDINAAGGVFGQAVQLILGDSGTDPDVAAATVADLLAEGSDVIVGAATSAVSLTVIDRIVEAGVIQFSPSNTSAEFTNYPDDGLYFRTSPSNALQGEMLAELVVDEAATAAVVYRDDYYGQSTAEPFAAKFVSLGGQPPVHIAYPPDDDDFTDEVAQIVALDPDVVVLVGYSEAAKLVTMMDDAGVGPAHGKNVWGADGFITQIGSLVPDPAILAGLRGTLPGLDAASLPPVFLDRLDDNGADGQYSYAAETYDAIVITALAALSAGSGDPSQIAAEIIGITENGEICTTFGHCAALMAEGVNIDYDGLAGPHEFNNCGEPTKPSFAVLAYDGGPTATTTALVHPATDNLTTGRFACQLPDSLADVLDSIIPQGGPGADGLYAALAVGNYRAFINQVEAKCCLPSTGKLFTRAEADLLIGLASTHL